MAKAGEDNPISRVLKRARERSGVKHNHLPALTEDVSPEFKVSQSFAQEIETKNKTPNPYKLLTLVRAYETTLAEVFREMGASDEEICGHSVSPVDQETLAHVKAKENRDFYEMLRLILEKGEPERRKALAEVLGAFSANLPGGSGGQFGGKSGSSTSPNEALARNSPRKALGRAARSSKSGTG